MVSEKEKGLTKRELKRKLDTSEKRIKKEPTVWTEHEDDILREWCTNKDPKDVNWKELCEKLNNKSYTQCVHRWQKVLDPKLVKGSWSQEEDELLRQLVAKHGPKNWSIIASNLNGRIGKQCRERWYNHLAPEIRKDPWTPEEDKIIIEFHAKYGNKWSDLAKLLPGRPSNAIKNHWNSTLKRRVQESVDGLPLSKPRKRNTTKGKESESEPMLIYSYEDTLNRKLDSSASPASDSPEDISPLALPQNTAAASWEPSHEFELGLYPSQYQNTISDMYSGAPPPNYVSEFFSENSEDYNAYYNSQDQNNNEQMLTKHVLDLSNVRKIPGNFIPATSFYVTNLYPQQQNQPMIYPQVNPFLVSMGAARADVPQNSIQHMQMQQQHMQSQQQQTQGPFFVFNPRGGPSNGFYNHMSF